MSPRFTRLALAGACAATLLVATPPALAMAPRDAGWSPMDPPAYPGIFAMQLRDSLYSVSCNGVAATGWSADAADDTVSDWDTALVTTTSVASACFDTPDAVGVRQDSATFAGQPWNYKGIVRVQGNRPFIDWDFVPSPRVGQWVGIGARDASGALLPLLERRIATVGTDSFTLDQPVDAAYIGAPVVDNSARALGMINSAGSVVTGAPQFCLSLFVCTDASRVWWNISAPSAVTNAKAVAGKGSVTVTWQPAASDGGAEVAYWYRIGAGDWIKAEVFRVKVPARKGTRVTVTISTINDAGPGPSTTVSAKAK